MDVVADKPEASDRKLNLEIQKFADRFPAPATIILVSSTHSRSAAPMPRVDG